ncbi:MAG: hypothetical protein H0T89_23655 [Deltaproteobacteria bacterium]|nr:hypothetical protein [Deltaproteobacteria bacterium]
MTEHDPHAKPTTAALFALLWDDLADVLGSSATATLLRRAAKHGAGHRPELRDLVIHRPAFEYEYILPMQWSNDAHGREALQALVRTLIPLLQQLTGPIVIRRLQAIPALVQAGLIDHEETAS